MTDEHAELTPDERDALDAWEPIAPPADFADRVLDARARARPAVGRMRWPRLAGLYAAVATAAAVTVVIAMRDPSQAARGSLAATTRTETRLGGRAVAVAETAAQLTWDIAADGAARIEQPLGEVFYRVDRGGTFAVHTPAGVVHVTGTCFRIEVLPMNKQHVLTSAAIGAALATAVVITVYEGRVIADSHGARTELGAGQRATLRGGGVEVESGAPIAGGAGGAGRSAAAPGSLADDAVASRGELLARAGEQRIEIGKLRSRVAELEAARAEATGAEPGRAWHDPSPERLQQWVRECRIRYDEPGFDRFTALPPSSSGHGAIRASEIPGYNAAVLEVQSAWRAQLRQLYIEATGDTAGADSLSIDAMRGEIEEKSPRGESNYVLQAVARERAGLAAAPADLAKLSPQERMIRAQIELGDQTEAALAKRIGPERAKALRGDAWSSRSERSGCP